MCIWMMGPPQSGMSVKIINICIKKSCHQKQKREKIELAVLFPGAKTQLSKLVMTIEINRGSRKSVRLTR